jgi:hypothetical protein
MKVVNDGVEEMGEKVRQKPKKIDKMVVFMDYYQVIPW